MGDYTRVTPISTITAEHFDVPLSDLLRGFTAKAGQPPTANDLAGLKKHPRFQGLNDQQIGSRLTEIRLATIDSIEVLRREDGSAADALAQAYRNRRISLAAWGGLPGQSVEIRDNGSARYGNEAINIFWTPAAAPGKTKIDVFDLDGFRLFNDLSIEGQYMIRPGYQGPPPKTKIELTSWALTNEIREAAVSSNAVKRLTNMVEVLKGIMADLKVPEGAC